MRILFLTLEPFDKANGVTKKVYSQVRAFNEHEECKLCYFESSNDFIEFKVDNEVVYRIPNGFWGRVIKFFKFNALYNIILRDNVEVVYVRYSHFSSPSLLSFFKKIQKLNIKIVCEVPTFPYDQEYTSASLFSKLKLNLDKLFRNRCFSYLNNVVTFSGESSIFGTKTISISNAIDYTLLYETVPLYYPKVFSLTVVANLQSWHAVDRLIKSVYAYEAKNIKKRKIHVNIIGAGDLLNELKLLTTKLKLNSVITFWGELSGDELFSVLRESSIGVDSLGRHRSGNNINNSLKSKEYLAFGLPVIKSHVDYSLDNTRFSSFIFNVDSTDKVFNIDDIITWFDKLNFDRHYISKEAKKEFSWSKQMYKVLDEIEQ